ncbi:MAG: glycogen synthase GlgA [Candidatus Eiseniibacteriota bacterium]
MNPMRICYVTSELAPLAKVGGLADVSGALPRELRARGHDVRVFLPLYRTVREGGAALTPDPLLRNVPLQLGRRTFHYSIVATRLPGSDLEVRLVDCPALYDRPGIYTQDDDEHLRFLLLTRAAIDGCQLAQWPPDILHCHDWQTALAPLYLKTVYRWDRLFERTRSVLTIHNLGYQGTFDAAVLPDLGLGEGARMLHQEDLRAGRIGFLKTGLAYADVLTTVSPTYAREIQTERLGMGLDGVLKRRANALVGILNGVDTAEWDPRTDRHLAARYSEKSLWRKEKNKQALLEGLGLPYTKGVPVVGIVSRLSGQKGIELLDPTLPELLRERDLRFVALGSGEPRYEQLLQGIPTRFPGRACFYRGFSDALAHRIEGGADFFLMPSVYEPCGLNQMYSMRYGTAPVVRATGGLADTVRQFDPATGEGTGFVFEHFNADGLRWALRLALRVYEDVKAWRRLQVNGMTTDFSWGDRARQYEELYRRVAATAEAPR